MVACRTLHNNHSLHIFRFYAACFSSCCVLQSMLPVASRPSLFSHPICLCCLGKSFLIALFFVALCVTKHVACSFQAFFVFSSHLPVLSREVILDCHCCPILQQHVSVQSIMWCKRRQDEDWRALVAGQCPCNPANCDGKSLFQKIFDRRRDSQRWFPEI